jgi:hypothetical protein
MAIRLESPDSSLQETDTFQDLPWQRSSRRTTKIKDFLGTGAGYVLICTALIWTVAYIFCHYRYWRDPDSWFYSEKGVYDFHYSQIRRKAAADFIAKYNETTSDGYTAPAHSDPVLCIGIVTVKRKQHVDVSRCI